MSTEMNATGALLHLRYTDKAGRQTVVEHRVWNSGLFFQARSDDASKAREAGDSKVKVELSNETEYNKARGRS